MHRSLLEILRCPYCGTPLSVVESDALVEEGSDIVQGVLGCECCAYPVVDGIPVLIASDVTRRAMHLLEAGRREDALVALLSGAEAPEPAERLRPLARGEVATYREALALLCDDAEGTWFLYHLSDPTYVCAEALLHAVAQQAWPVRGRTLDVCGGAGHLSRVLHGVSRREPDGTPATVLADLFFWKLWLARRFTAPDAAPVCCDANHPLPFTPGSFSTVLLLDAFPYVWHKRLLADEMMRLADEDGVVIMPHLHSAAGENFSAGDVLTPAAYQRLFEPLGARLFSDVRMLDDVLERGVVDLAHDVTPAALGDESSLTLIATKRLDLFRRYRLAGDRALAGEVTVNPLYRVERRDGVSILTLEFPTPEYEAEFGECRRYLPERLTVEADLTGRIVPEDVGPSYEELRARRVLIDAPVGYAQTRPA
ncbi:MAG: Trm112 family protein [Gemmatimonadales bacterium]